MKVKRAMRKGVQWVEPQTPVEQLARLVREHDIGAIPIGDNDRLIGMVTDRDIVCRCIAAGVDPKAVRARRYDERRRDDREAANLLHFHDASGIDA